MRLLTIFGAASWLACGALACGAHRPVPNDSALTEASASKPPATRGSDVGSRETRVEVSEDIRAECHFPQAAGDSPRFELDESTLRGPERNQLDDVASCLKDGPLKSRTVTIVGRTDPRGTEAHNQDLGANRAEATRNYLIAKGVPEGRLLVVSRGEEGARGTEEEGWALDRRVDLVLRDRSEPAASEQKLPVPPANPPQSNVNAAPGAPAPGQPPVPPANPPMKSPSPVKP